MPLRHVVGKPSIWVPPRAAVRPRTLPAHEWRRTNYFLTTVREDDYPYRCLGCGRALLTGERTISCRSASEKTPGFWGPIEDMCCLPCWESVPGDLRPPLGRKLRVWRKYGDYPWRGVW